MARKPRAAAQAAAASMRAYAVPRPLEDFTDHRDDTPIRDVSDGSDQEMADVTLSTVSTPQPALRADVEDGVGHDEDADGRDEENGSLVREESEATPSQPATPQPGMSLIPRKRRLGRPPKNKPPDWDDVGIEKGSDMTLTPMKRRRGRPPTSGRWSKRGGGPSHVTQVPIDKEGNLMDVIDDEIALPEDSEGEKKVDKLGNLKDGREYRVRTFTILGRGNRLYMLSTEPARCIGFRDSYLFFQKHKQLYKIIIGEDEKRDLIDRDIIPHSYKGRAIGVVTARSVFREFGARIVIGGKKVTDDYQTAAARAAGDVEGDLAVPDDKLPGSGEIYDRNRYVAWHGASSVYHSGMPSIPLPNGKSMDKKRKIVVTGDNWMLEHALAASRWNSALTEERRKALGGIYDPHCNIMQYPRTMQPTHARWERVEPSASISTRTAIPSTSKATNGHVSPTVDHNMDGDTDATGSDLDTDIDTNLNKNIKHLNISGTPPLSSASSSASYASTSSTATIFKAVPPIISRNYAVEDIIYVTPSVSNLGIPGPDGDSMDIGSKGLNNIPDNIAALLPEECKKAFDEAKTREKEWRERWKTESHDGLRAVPHISYTYVSNVAR